MNKKPGISIIMPVYGVEKYLADAIESVLAQSYQDWELLIVNDGSTDNSYTIAKEYELKDVRITVFNKENGGLSDARNYGLQYAKGEYIHFFDSDDQIGIDFYASLLPIAKNKGCNVLVCGYQVRHVYDDEIEVEERLCFDGTLEQSPLSLPVTISLYFNYAWNKLFLRKFLMENNLKYEKGLYLVEDCEFMSRLIDYTDNIYFITGCDYYYMDRQCQTLSKMFDDKIIGFSERRIKALDKIYSMYCCSCKNKSSFIEKDKFNNSVRLLNRLFSTTIKVNRNHRKLYFKEICESSVLHLSAPYIAKYNTLDKILLYILNKKIYILCELLFQLKQLIKLLHNIINKIFVNRN